MIEPGNLDILVLSTIDGVSVSVKCYITLNTAPPTLAESENGNYYTCSNTFYCSKMFYMTRIFNTEN